MLWHNFCGLFFRMKTFIYIAIALLAIPAALCAQHYPHRTPEDIASKQTEMLVRELHITDSLVRDTLYRMHLKFAIKRQISHTRAEAMQFMQEANEELRHILTPEQYQQFMNEQVNYAPHRPQTLHNRITTTVVDTTQAPSSNPATHIQPPPGWHQSPVHR